MSPPVIDWEIDETPSALPLTKSRLDIAGETRREKCHRDYDREYPGGREKNYAIISPRGTVLLFARESSISEGDVGEIGGTSGLSREAANEWYGHVNQELDEILEECARADWNGEGASAVTESTIQMARRFIIALPAGVPQPEINPDNDGEISFDWDVKSRLVFSVSLGESGVLSFAGIFGASRIHGREDFEGTIPQTIRQQIDRVSTF